ncbi:uncharacterized protein O3C94_007717 [Discoglossus pictus]
MSVPEEDEPSVLESLYCKICHVAFLNEESLQLHCGGERHKGMEEDMHGEKPWEKEISCLEDFIKSSKRKEPLIGLQYVEPLHPYGEYTVEPCYSCGLCKMKGGLFFMMKHLTHFKHRTAYIWKLYAHWLPPLNCSYYEKVILIREQAKEIESTEGIGNKYLLLDHAYRLAHKNEFWKCNFRLQCKLNARKEDALRMCALKDGILKYMESFKLSSSEEAISTQKLTEDIKAAVEVYNQNSEGGSEGMSEQNNEFEDLKFPQFSGHKSRKRKAKCEEEMPSTSSSCNVEEVEKDSERVKARRMSQEVLSTFTLFAQGSESKSKPATEESCSSGQNSDETPAAAAQTTEKDNEPAAEMPTKSTWVYRSRRSSDSTKGEIWKSFFNKEPAQTPSTSFLYSTKNTSLFANSNLSLREQLSKFSFSLSGSDCSSKNFGQLCSPEKSFLVCSQTPSFKEESTGITESKVDPQNNNDNTEHVEENSQCGPRSTIPDTGLSASVYKPGEADYSDVQNSFAQKDVVVKSEQAEPIAIQHPDTETISAEGPSQHTEAAPHPDVKIERSEQTIPIQYPAVKPKPVEDLPSSSTSNVWKIRELSPEILKLFKGKDVKTVHGILKSLSSVYPSLRKVDLEIFAKVLSETGAFE